MIEMILKIVVGYLIVKDIINLFRSNNKNVYFVGVLKTVKEELTGILTKIEGDLVVNSHCHSDDANGGGSACMYPDVDLEILMKRIKILNVMIDGSI